MRRASLTTLTGKKWSDAERSLLFCSRVGRGGRTSNSIVKPNSNLTWNIYGISNRTSNLRIEPSHKTLNQTKFLGCRINRTEPKWHINLKQTVLKPKSAHLQLYDYTKIIQEIKKDYLISAILVPPLPMMQPMRSLGTVISWVCWLVFCWLRFGLLVRS